MTPLRSDDVIVTSLETTLSRTSRTAAGKDATIFCLITLKIKTHYRNFC